MSSVVVPDTEAAAQPEPHHGRLLGKMHRTALILDHLRSRYERVCEQRDRLERDNAALRLQLKTCQQEIARCPHHTHIPSSRTD
jgi:hypothetical protein